MSENKIEETKEQEKGGGFEISIKSWFGLKTMQYLYALGSVIVMCFGAYKWFHASEEKPVEKNPQIVINVPEQKASVPAPVQTAPVSQPVQPVQQTTTEKIVIIEKQVEKPKEEPKETKVEPVEEKQPEEEDPFGFAKASGKRSTTEAQPQKVKTVTVPCYVTGDVTVQDGNSIKVRLSEDATIGNNTVLKNTQFIGEMKITGNRINIEFKENKNLPFSLFAIDKDKNFGIPNQSKLTDGFKFFLTNKN